MTVNIVIVTGLSGAGKSSVMLAFEALGYECMDNYPVALMSSLRQYLAQSHKYMHVALAIPLDDVMTIYNELINEEAFSVTLLYLDADSQTLVSRYQFTRRVHPLILDQKANTLDEAIGIEQTIGNKIKHVAAEVIDTSSLNQRELTNKIQSLFAYDVRQHKLAISFVSFGYRFGIPKDSDFIFDVRSLPNPFYDNELRPMTGLDEPVYRYVIDAPQTQDYIGALMPFLTMVFKQVEGSGKRHIVVAIGCTGGKHRSISLCRFLSDHFKEQYHVYLEHKELKRYE